MDRAFTVREIDALRRAVDNHYLWGRYNGLRYNGMSRSYKETDKAKVVEERVRTYMLAGITAADLLQDELTQDAEHEKRMAEYRDAQGMQLREGSRSDAEAEGLRSGPIAGE